ncbi:MAG: c-type cytochrome [Nitrosomonadales bacterium]|nr:c-type cytochrome [Nitrosomonadales bacterium]
MHSKRTLTEVNAISVRKFSGWALAAMLLIGAGNTLAGQHDRTPPGVTRSGKTIFHNFCSVCHGDKGDGQSRARNSFLVPPRNYTTPESAIELTRDRMINSVTHGRPGTAMIAWGTTLSAQEVEAVVDYIRATFMKLNNQSMERVRPSEKLLASRGGVLYMQVCVTCHGDTGVRQISGRMQPPPRDFTSPAVIAELTRKRMIASVTNGRPGTAMRPYGDQYSQSDIEAMVDFIRDAFMSNVQQKN